MMYGPQLITLMGDDRAPEPFGFWVTAAAAAAKIGLKVGKGIAKKVKSKRKKKKDSAAAKRAALAPAVGPGSPAVNGKRVSITENELRAAASGRSGIPPIALIGGAAVLALLLLRGGSR